MPKLVYAAEENKKFELLPDGDYLLTVTSAGTCYSTGGTTSGAEQIELNLEAYKAADGPPFGTLTEWLTFHRAMLWKVDTFITAAGFTVKKGEEIELTAENVIGRRAWARIGTYEKANGKKFNQVKMWYTDRPKLPPVAITKPAEDDDIPF